MCAPARLEKENPSATVSTVAISDDRMTAKASFIDIDIHGRGFDAVFGASAEAAGNLSNLVDHIKTQDAECTIRDETFIEYDHYGRNNPRLFGRSAHMTNAAEAKKRTLHTRTTERNRKSLRAVLFPIREKTNNARRKISSRFSYRAPRKISSNFASDRADPRARRNENIQSLDNIAATPEGRSAELARLINSEGHTTTSPRRVFVYGPNVTNHYQVESLVKVEREPNHPPQLPCVRSSSWRNSGIRDSVLSTAEESDNSSQHSCDTAGIISVETFSSRSDSLVDESESETVSSSASRQSSSSTFSTSSDDSFFSQDVTGVQMAEAFDEISSNEDLDNIVEFVADDDSAGNHPTSPEKIEVGVRRTVRGIVKDLDAIGVPNPETVMSSAHSASASGGGTTPGISECSNSRATDISSFSVADDFFSNVANGSSANVVDDPISIVDHLSTSSVHDDSSSSIFDDLTSRIEDVSSVDDEEYKSASHWFLPEISEYEHVPRN